MRNFRRGILGTAVTGAVALGASEGAQKTFIETLEQTRGKMLRKQFKFIDTWQGENKQCQKLQEELF